MVSEVSGLYKGTTLERGPARILAKGIRPLQHGPITPLPLPSTGYASVGVLGLAGNFSILRPLLTGACPSSQPPPPELATWGHRRRPRLTWARSRFQPPHPKLATWGHRRRPRLTWARSPFQPPHPKLATWPRPPRCPQAPGTCQALG